MNNTNTPLDPYKGNPNLNTTANSEIPITDILGGFGNALAIVFFLMPFLMIIDLIKTKEISKIPWLMFIFTILNCEFWTLYGLKIHAWPIYLCNGIGAFTNHIYLIIFFLYLKSASIYKRFFYIFLLIFTFLFSFFMLFIYVDDNSLLGATGCVMNILMFASPLQKLSEVCEKKDNSFIPIQVSIVLTLNTIIWIGYGVTKGMDWFVITPNLFGSILCLLQIVLWFKFIKEEKIYDGFKEENQSDGSDEEMNKKKNVILGDENYNFQKVEIAGENENENKGN